MLTASAYLDPIEDQPARGYTLNCTYHHKQPGRQLSERQIDLGTTLVSKVRQLMLDQMEAAGWVEVGKEASGNPIWQHSSVVTQKQDVVPSIPQEQDTVTLPQPALILDDLTKPPMTWAMRERNEHPLTYQARAVQGDVKALITIRYYGDLDYCDFSHILAMFVKDIMAAPLAQRPIHSKQAINRSVAYVGSDSDL